MKKTLVLGASPNPDRYSNMAIISLRNSGHEVVPIGLRNGTVSDLKIIKGQPYLDDIHTITLYLGPKNQPTHYDYILKTNPKRIIFNPGTENDELIDLAHSNNINVEIACTLVLLRLGSY